MVTIKNDYDLDDDVYDELIKTIENSSELEDFIDLGSKIMNKYNLSEKLAGQFLIEITLNKYKLKAIFLNNPLYSHTMKS